MLLHYQQADKSKISGTLFGDYIPLKEAMPDGILLYDMGSFYDTYFDDARVVASLTTLTLSTKNNKRLGDCYHQTGIPKQTFDIHLKKILDENIDVYICDIPESEKNKVRKKNEVIKREFVRKYTPGTITETELLNESENNYIACIYCKNNTCNLSYADVSTGQFYKTSGTIKQIEFEIEKINPREILLSKKQEHRFKMLIEDYHVKFLEDENFNRFEVEEVIINYCEANQGKYYAVLDKIIEYKIETFLMLDNITRRTLEMSRTRRRMKRKGSIYWFLNYTKTPMGARLLKKVMNEPLLDIEKIKERLDTICELIEKKPTFFLLEEKLENFCDLARICTKISNSTIEIKEFNAIVDCSENIKSLYYLSKAFSSDLLHLNKDKINGLLSIAKKIKQAVYRKSDGEKKSYDFINKGYDAHLDYIKKLLKEKEDEVDYLEKKLQKRMEMKELKIKKYDKFGYCIEVPKSLSRKMSGSDFIFRHSTDSFFRYTHKDLEIYIQEVNNLKFQIIEIEKKFLDELRIFAKNFVDTLRQLSNNIALMDIMGSLACCAINNNLVMPQFNKEVFEARNAFHPSLLKLNNEIVKNDIFIQNDTTIILTGANMSGKSTFLKSSAIIAILAQIGSFVPAEYSNLTIIDKIFIRQGSTDDILTNNSSFMVEMNDLQFIIDNLTNRSLVLLDEPAKSTDAKESGAIVKAFCEYILNHYKTKAMIVTHNTDITKLEEQYPDKVFNYIMGNSETETVNDRKIRRGIASTSDAISTAILAGLPSELIDNAREYMKT